METVVSGIRSTGNLHLGNYFGAIQNFLKMQHEHKCFFFIADYHALTTHPNPNELHSSVKQVVMEYLAVGLDPEKATIYLQSDLPQIPELYLLLNMHAYIGELERVASFKEKVRKHPDNVNAGLLTYPVLMAADIIIHKATKVPVGKDQEQHLEMTRDYVNRFNNFYGKDFFPLPYAYNFGKQLIKVPGLDGAGKMGKSEGAANAVYLADSPEVIKKKVMRAVTDSGPTTLNQTISEPIANLLSLLSLVSTDDKVEAFKEDYAQMKIKYGDLKKQLASDLISYLEPIQENINNLSNKPQYLREVIAYGAEKARKNASETIAGVRALMGLKGF